MNLKQAFALVCLGVGVVQHPAAAECLSYRTGQTVSGTVAAEHGDLVLQLPAPVCVNADGTDPAESNIKQMQISFDDMPFDRSLAGHRVRIIGAVVHSFNIHHHTRVLISPDKIERMTP